MRKIFMVSVTLITLLELTGLTMAAQHAARTNRRNAPPRLSRSEIKRLKAQMQGVPTIKITTTPDRLDLGRSGFPGEYESTAIVTVNIESNCFHGPVIATISRLKSKSGATIEPRRVYVCGSETYGYVSMARPVVISRPALGPHSVDLCFKVDTKVNDPAGSYEGAITFTIAPPS